MIALALALFMALGFAGIVTESFSLICVAILGCCLVGLADLFE